MKKFFQNLPIRSKLGGGFMIISLVLLYLGVREFFVLKKLERNQMNFTENITLNTSQREVKFYLRSDLQNLRDIVYNQEVQDMKTLWDRHLSGSKMLNAHLDTMIMLTDQKKGTEFDEFISNIHKLSLRISDLYIDSILPPYEQIYNLKTLILKSGLDIVEDVSDTTIIDSLNIGSNLLKDDQIVVLEKQIKTFNRNVDSAYKSMSKHIESLDQSLSKESLGYQKQIQEDIDFSLSETTLMIIIGMLISLLVAWVLARLILKPISNIKKSIEELSVGKIPERVEVNTKDEIGDIAQGLNSVLLGLSKASEFSVEIGKSNFEHQFSPLSDNDTLGLSLIEMRKNLLNAEMEEKKRKNQDEIARWMSEGQTKFVEILRYNTSGIADLSHEIIKNLIKYVGANQGGLFILNEESSEDIHLQMVAAFAYNRKKYVTKNIKIGEGLLGTCAREKKTLHLTEIPDDYIEIRSGLGDANPNAILIVPMMMEDNLIGVIELATFSSFEKHVIEFVEKVSESIAATFSTAKINARTAELLKKSQIQAEEMQEKEEEMRQNMEELQATQEEAQRREELLTQKVEEFTANEMTLKRKIVLLEEELKKLNKPTK